MANASGLTASLIPCCICGAIIAPNSCNQCTSCLASVDIASIIRRGPGGGDLVLHQCRQCRKYDRAGDGRNYIRLEPEGPDLMAVLLKQIPALGKRDHHVKRAGVRGLKILDSAFVWTEPHSMRMRIALTLKADVHDVSIQQRVKVEFIVQWKQCPDCIKESRQRTWQAIVQLRQKRNDDSRKGGLLVLELAIARNAEIRKDILSVQTRKNGFDFYFSSVDKARHFTQYLAKAAPVRSKTTQSLVSEDIKNNTANIKTTIVCEMVPLVRDDLIVVHKRARGVGNLTGRLCLVWKMSSVIHLVDASPARDADIGARFSDLHAESYWKGGEEKSYRLFLSPNHLVRFVVLDVEHCRERSRMDSQDEDTKRVSYQGPTSGVMKYALADVEVAKETDFGVNDETFRCVTHLGHLLQVGDIVLGYDLNTTVLPRDEENIGLNSSYDMPDIILVRKVKGTATAAMSTHERAESAMKIKAKSSASRKRERRMNKEEQKQKELEEAAARMGLDSEHDVYLDLDDIEIGIGETFSAAVQKENANFEKQLEMDEDLASDLLLVEHNLASGMEKVTVDEAALFP